MVAKYGIPYQGSKSRIAEDLIKVLPSGNRFVDLFGGGGAMTHIACLSGKYDEVLYNDIQPNLIALLKDAIAGKYDYSCFTPEFITRDEFDKRKDEDAYIKYIWSFSNNGRNYLYSHDIEDGKRSVHNYVVFGIRDEFLKQTFPTIELVSEGIRERRLEWGSKFRLVKMGDMKRIQPPETLECMQHLIQLEHMQHLTQLEHMQQDGRLKFCSIDYRTYEYMGGDIVYCDPPYENTVGYNKETFDSKGFYDWAYSRPYVVYFSSYDGISDKRFTPIWAKTKRNLMSGASHQSLKIETLYCNKDIDFKFNNYDYVKSKRDEEQITLF